MDAVRNRYAIGMFYSPKAYLNWIYWRWTDIGGDGERERDKGKQRRRKRIMGRVRGTLFKCRCCHYIYGEVELLTCNIVRLPTPFLRNSTALMLLLLHPCSFFFLLLLLLLFSLSPPRSLSLSLFLHTVWLVCLSFTDFHGNTTKYTFPLCSLFNKHNSQWKTRIEIMRKFNVIVSGLRLSFPNCGYFNSTGQYIPNVYVYMYGIVQLR